MPISKVRPGSPKDWLRLAQSSLLHGSPPKREGVRLEEYCFDLQQAAEKAIKAVMVFRKVRFPPSHDIGELLALLEHSGHAVPSDIREANGLSRYAVITRYPGVRRQLTEEDYRHALESSEAVVRWAEGLIAGK